jgi:plasmid stability protein
MDAITIRKLPRGTKQRLRMRAAVHGRSMEAEAREILVDALARSLEQDLSWIEQLIDAGNEVGGVELELPDHQPATSADLSKA